jgi:hypothetical protein
VISRDDIVALLALGFAWDIKTAAPLVFIAPHRTSAGRSVEGGGRIG